MTRLEAFWRLPLRTKTLVFEAFGQLCVAWMLVRFFAFKTWKNRLGQPRPGDFKGAEITVGPEITTVRKAVNQVNFLFGGKFTCLMIAMAGQRMLHRRGVSSAVVLGASKTEVENRAQLGAHAWLNVGSHVLLGEEEKNNFAPVVSYVKSVG